MLRKMIEQPLIHKTAIQDRLDAVEMLKDNLMAREELREYMNSIYDLERLTMKVSYRSANPRDLISFKTSIQYLPYIKDILAQFSKGVLAKMAGDLDTLEDLYELLEASIEEDPPIPIKEGGIIKVETPIYASKVQLVCPKCDKGTRVGYKLVDGKKVRVCKHCGAEI